MEKLTLKFISNKKNKLKKFNLFFKLLFLLPNVEIKYLFYLIKLLKNLSYNCRKKLIIQILIKFKFFFKNYLINFIKLHKKSNFKSNKTIYKILGTFLYLEIYKKNKKGLIFLKYNNNHNKKEKLQYYDIVFFNHNLKDISLYKSFFLKNSKIKWDLSRLTRKKHDKTNKYKFAYKSIFVWPFTIVIKPFIIIIKNIFFKPFFVFKKWFKKNNNNKIFENKKLYTQLYKIIVIEAKQKNLTDNIVNLNSSIFWYLVQKYYIFMNHKENIIKNNYYLPYNIINNNLFFRAFNKYNVKNKLLHSKKFKYNKKKFLDFYNFFKKYLKISFIGLSFFLRLYGLYFFWFLYFINKIFYLINKILFNYWSRFIYIYINTENIINNNLFFSFKTLYKNLKKNEYIINNIEFENCINDYILNIFNINYWNFNFLIKTKLNNNFYKNYYLILFLFYYKNYFFYNVFLNYNNIFDKNYKKYYKYNNNIFDSIHIENYKYNQIYKLEYFSIIQKIYKKYPDYYKINNSKYYKLNPEGKKDYLDLLDKRNKTILLR